MTITEDFIKQAQQPPPQMSKGFGFALGASLGVGVGLIITFILLLGVIDVYCYSKVPAGSPLGSYVADQCRANFFGGTK